MDSKREDVTTDPQEKTRRDQHNEWQRRLRNDGHSGMVAGVYPPTKFFQPPRSYGYNQSYAATRIPCADTDYKAGLRGWEENNTHKAYDFLRLRRWPHGI